MNKFSFGLLVILNLFCSRSFGQNQLWVNDPHGWYWEQGIINEATVVISPSGLFFQYDLYLTLSAEDYNWLEDSTQLEIVLDFTLPENSLVNDLWLWVEDEIMIAQLLDKWTASSIYEGIVQRRRDPAILYKVEDNSYQLRIYPVFINSSRKVKLSYMVPADWHSRSVTSSLPTWIFNTSMIPLEKIDILFKNSVDWSNPVLVEYPETDFELNQTDSLAEYYSATLDSPDLQNGITLSFDSPMEDGLYLTTESDVYQLALLPSKYITETTTRNLLILIDYDGYTTDVSKGSIISNLTILLQNYLSQTDSFNVVFSGITTTYLSDSWLEADSQNISLIGNYFSEHGLNSYSNLVSSLGSAVNFLNENPGEASVLIISASDQINNYQAANDLLSDLLNSLDNLPPFHIVDLINRSYNSKYINDHYYRGNEYFYVNLSKRSSGTFNYIWNGTRFEDNLRETFSGLKGYLKAYDLYTTIQSGFCYNRFDLTRSHLVYLDRPILQIGKFRGNLPFIVNLSGAYNDEIFNIGEEIPVNYVPESGNYNQLWNGIYMNSLETDNPTNSVITEIIERSLDNRVLSVFTAFLALEPSDSLQPCFDCFDPDDGGWVIGTEDIDETPTDTLIQAYPNPFNAEVNIKITLAEGFRSENVTMKIYNMLGQEICEFEPSDFSGQQIINLRWNGRNKSGQPVSSGIYLFSITTPNTRKTLKLLMLK